jgi:hypothetical protein
MGIRRWTLPCTGKSRRTCVCLRLRHWLANWPCRREPLSQLYTDVSFLHLTRAGKSSIMSSSSTPHSCQHCSTLQFDLREEPKKVDSGLRVSSARAAAKDGCSFYTSLLRLDEEDENKFGAEYDGVLASLSGHSIQLAWSCGEVVFEVYTMPGKAAMRHTRGNRIFASQRILTLIFKYRTV